MYINGTVILYTLWGYLSRGRIKNIYSRKISGYRQAIFGYIVVITNYNLQTKKYSLFNHIDIFSLVYYNETIIQFMLC